MASFAEKLRNLRINKGIGQKEVGAVIGVSDSSIRKYESGTRTPNPEAITKLAKFFDVTTDELLGTTSLKPTEPKKPKDLLKLLEQEDYTLNGEIASPEDKEKIAKMIELMYWDAKEKNKRK
ncbi:MAG: helix-turn-helix domain-containing protein [Pelosinus sp.]|nr:helix-turn-helix domain-containing protein [Pelosinus sp.]